MKFFFITMDRQQFEDKVKTILEANRNHTPAFPKMDFCSVLLQDELCTALDERILQRLPGAKNDAFEMSLFTRDSSTSFRCNGRSMNFFWPKILQQSDGLFKPLTDWYVKVHTCATNHTFTKHTEIPRMMEKIETIIMETLDRLCEIWSQSRLIDGAEVKTFKNASNMGIAFDFSQTDNISRKRQKTGGGNKLGH